MECHKILPFMSTFSGLADDEFQIFLIHYRRDGFKGEGHV